jgi:hypothetical protein
LRIGLGFRESGNTTWRLEFLSRHFVNKSAIMIFAPCFPFLPGANQTKIDGVVEAYLRPPLSSYTKTTTIGGGWFLTIELHSTIYGLQFHPIPPLSGPKLALLRWGGRGAPPTSPSSHIITITIDGGWFLTTGLHYTTCAL